MCNNYQWITINSSRHPHASAICGHRPEPRERHTTKPPPPKYHSQKLHTQENTAHASHLSNKHKQYAPPRCGHPPLQQGPQLTHRRSGVYLSALCWSNTTIPVSHHTPATTTQVHTHTHNPKPRNHHQTQTAFQMLCLVPPRFGQDNAAAADNSIADISIMPATSAAAAAAAFCECALQPPNRKTATKHYITNTKLAQKSLHSKLLVAIKTCVCVCVSFYDFACVRRFLNGRARASDVYITVSSRCRDDDAGVTS